MGVSVAVAGASGYAAAELFRLLPLHPEVRQITAFSRQPETLPLPPGITARPYEALFEEAADVVFLSLPAKAAREAAPALVRQGKIVIDLSGGHRLSEERYRDVYQDEESIGAGKAVYGLPEWFREAIRGERLVANPGCYATALALLLFPLAVGGEAPKLVVADGISGHSGAGRSPKSRYLLAEASEDVSPYRLVGHPHVAEVEEAFAARFGETVTVHFTPHLAPLSRGLVVTLHVPVSRSAGELHALVQDVYAREPFIRVLPSGEDPHTRRVLGTNLVELVVAKDQRTGWAVLTAALDNLGKGAAGQAIQNMNILLDVPEETGLKLPAFVV